MTRRLRSDLIYVLTLAALYYLAGRLSLLLTIRGGHGAPVWPAAGIALAFVLARGYRMWPGVFHVMGVQNCCPLKRKNIIKC